MRWPVLTALSFVGCTSAVSPVTVPVAAEADAVDAQTVEIRFSEILSGPPTVTAFGAADQEPLAVESVQVDGTLLRLRTAVQTGGRLYAVAFDNLTFDGIEVADAPSQVNFVGFATTQVVLRMDARGFVTPAAVTALVTLDPISGDPLKELVPVPMVEVAPKVYTATVTARVVPGEQLAARAVGPSGEPVAQLQTFFVASEDTVFVGLVPNLPEVPEFDVPADRNPGDGKATIRIIYDDRFARALTQPALRSSLDSNGAFDGSVPRVDPLRPITGEPRVFEVTLEVDVDANRSLDGTSPDTFPYVVFLVHEGEDIAQRGTTFVVPDETPQLLIVPVANPALVPVTFRVDVGDSFVTPDGSQRGYFPGEGIFLTGEFPAAEDALGRLAADAFTGGERAELEMDERSDAPGIFEKTIFLPRNRPFGWKVVRCPTGRGCAELNRNVSSSGRAFPTVMKNLMTANRDGARDPTVTLIDPAMLEAVTVNGVTVDYRQARVSEAGDEQESGTVMFKQEAPDLVVTVGETPVVTDVVVVGTWRDINIGPTPAEIIEMASNLELGPFDYDDGMQGVLPPLRDIQLPLDPGAPPPPPLVPTDGLLDAAAVQVSGEGPGLWGAYNGRELYVATTPPGPGEDRFVWISTVAPTSLRAAPWTKAGQVFAGPGVFFATEGDGDFNGWFAIEADSESDRLLDTGNLTGRGEVTEGLIDFGVAGITAPSTQVWISVLSYATNDSDPLTGQLPVGNNNLDVEVDEVFVVDLASLQTP